jgi:diaminopimelate decarboxylase
VNVGGGLGIPYRPGDNEFDIEALGRESSVLLHRFGARNGFVPKFCMESGRYMTGPHGVFVNRVINVAKKYKKFIGVETAMPGLMRHGMYKAYHHVYVLGPDGYPKDGDLEEVSVVGPICEDCDRLATDIMLPPVEEGDFIVTADTGAHGSAMGFNYNGRLRPQELLFKTNGYVKQITRHETAEDLFRRFMEVSDTGLKLSV